MPRANKPAAKRKPGRPTKLDAALTKKIVALCREGLFREQVAVAAGIAKATFYNWLNPDGPHFSAAFLDAIEKAEVDAERDALRDLRERKPGWQSRAWFLERRYRDRWNPPPRDVVQVTQNANVPSTFTVNMGRDDDDAGD